MPYGQDHDNEADGALLANIRNGAWLDRQTFPPLRYAVPGLIPEGFALLIGPPKAGKSWLALSMLLAVASGGAVLGKIKVGTPRRVLYLALEDGDRRMQDRCRQLLGDAPIPAKFSYLTLVEPGLVLPVVEAFLRQHDDTALVVLDTLGKVMPPAIAGETTYQRDYRVGGRLKAIADARPGLALVVLHHDRKAGGDDFVDAVSGTHGLAGSADTVVVLHRKRQSTEGLLKITGRDVPESEYAITTSDGVWALDGVDLAQAAARAVEREEAGELGDVSTSILAFVRDAGPEGVAAKAVAEKFGPDAYQYLRRQVNAGRLVKLQRGRYACPRPPVRSVRTSETDGSTHPPSDTSDGSDTAADVVSLFGDDEPEDIA